MNPTPELKQFDLARFPELANVLEELNTAQAKLNGKGKRKPHKIAAAKRAKELRKSRKKAARKGKKQ